MPLEEAAQRFDSAYRLLLDAPPDDISTPDGPARVVERHSCEYGAHRFGHVILQYRGRVVSLLVTANDRATGDVESAGCDSTCHWTSQKGLSVVSVNGSHHAILLVSDLENTELTQLSKFISVPLARRLEASVAADRGSLASLQFKGPFQSLTLNSGDWPGSDAASLQVVRRSTGQSLTTWVTRFEQ